jgi:hypothetical protein
MQMEVQGQQTKVTVEESLKQQMRLAIPLAVVAGLVVLEQREQQQVVVTAGLAFLLTLQEQQLQGLAVVVVEFIQAATQQAAVALVAEVMEK